MNEFTLQGLAPEVAAAVTAQIAATAATGTEARVLYSPSTTLEVYVDSVNGDDANSGTSAADAVKSIDQVYRVAPVAAIGGARIIVHLAGATTGTTPRQYSCNVLTFMGHAFRGPSMIAAPVSLSSAALDVVPTTAVTNRSRLNFATANPGWATNELRGYFLRVKRAGVLRYPELPISENDGTHLWVNVASVHGDLLATDTVEIVHPAVKIIGTNVSAGVPILIVDGQSLGRLVAYSALEKVTLGDFVSLSPNVVVQMDRCMAVGVAVFQALGRFSYVNTSFTGASLLIYGSHGPADAVARVDFTVSKLVDFHVSGGTVFMSSQSDATPSVLVVDHDMSVYGAGPAGLYIRGPSAHFSAKNGATVQGYATGGTGISATQGARVHLSSTAADTSLTGDKGALQVGNGAAVAYGAGVGAFHEAAGFNGNLTRVLEGTAVAPTGDTSQIENVF